MANSNPENIRTAAYLAAREQLRLDLKGGGRIKCNPPNRQCGDRCIPPKWKCRATGEGTDSHSRVVAGDPLAGAAAIARGRARLAKGLRTGNVTDIQGGRAAIARGVVKSVPGQNLQQKQALRKRVEGSLLPVATGLFTVWALRQGHEGAKVLFPQYARGPARAVENAAGTAVGYVLDRVPIYGVQRQATRRNAALQANLLGRAARIATLRDPATAANNNSTFPTLARTTIQQRGVTIPHLRDTLSEALTVRNEDGKVTKGYNTFRSNVLSGVMGATNEGQSIFSQAASINFLADQYKIPIDRLRGANNKESKGHLITQLNAKLTDAADSMRRDMAVRGLDRKRPEDVDRYITIATESGRRQVRSLPPEGQKLVLDRLGGTVRDLVTKPSRSGFTKEANDLYDQTVRSYDDFFKDAAARIKADTSPTLTVGAASYGDSPIRSTLIGTAEILKSKVRISGPITGANHAELVLQRVYHEYAVPGKKYTPGRKATWTATDADVKYAAQDLGWDNQGGVAGAYSFLQRTRQFPNLALRPREASATPAQTSSPPRAFGATPKPKGPGTATTPRKLRSREEIISMLVKGGRSPEAAANEADRILARRIGKQGKNSPRVDAYLTFRAARQ